MVLCFSFVFLLFLQLLTPLILSCWFFAPCLFSSLSLSLSLFENLISLWFMNWVSSSHHLFLCTWNHKEKTPKHRHNNKHETEFLGIREREKCSKVSRVSKERWEKERKEDKNEEEWEKKMREERMLFPANWLWIMIPLFSLKISTEKNVSCILMGKNLLLPLRGRKLERKKTKSVLSFWCLKIREREREFKSSQIMIMMLRCGEDGCNLVHNYYHFNLSVLQSFGTSIFRSMTEWWER